jgi:hypothetical protein
MLTQMTDEDSEVALAAFDVAQSSRDEPGLDDRKVLEVISSCTMSPGARCRQSEGH